MKKLATTAALILFAGCAFAQGEVGSACGHEGDYFPVFDRTGASVDTSVCKGGQWVAFKVGGRKHLLISYTITGKGIQRSGSIVTIDGVPGSFSWSLDEPYKYFTTKSTDGKVDITLDVVTTGETMWVVPLLGEHGAVTVQVRHSESVLTSMGSVGTGDRGIQKPDVLKVSTTHTLVMDIGKEANVPVQGATPHGKEQYMLKIVATEI